MRQLVDKSMKLRIYFVLALIYFNINLNAKKLESIQIFGSMYHLANQEIPTVTLISFAKEIESGKYRSYYDVFNYPENKDVYINKKYGTNSFFEMTTKDDSLLSLL